ncbi:MAG TPA: hypothetical protein VKR06_18130 [Ktedonosporobacter sp.]|nr:hypothetical protein [Ktedonosporobacter sp.]
MSVVVSVISITHTLMVVPSRLVGIVIITLLITGFLCLLNIALAVIFRKKALPEVLSYYMACGIELTICVFALLVYLGVISYKLPYQLPPGLPINRAQILAAVAIGIGLFPAAYWHRVNVSDLPGRIAQDAKAVNERAGQVRHGPPGQWMN